MIQLHSLEAVPGADLSLDVLLVSVKLLGADHLPTELLVVTTIKFCKGLVISPWFPKQTCTCRPPCTCCTCGLVPEQITNNTIQISIS